MIALTQSIFNLIFFKLWSSFHGYNAFSTFSIKCENIESIFVIIAFWTSAIIELHATLHGIWLLLVPFLLLLKNNNLDTACITFNMHKIHYKRYDNHSLTTRKINRWNFRSIEFNYISFVYSIKSMFDIWTISMKNFSNNSYNKRHELRTFLNSLTIKLIRSFLEF